MKKKVFVLSALLFLLAGCTKAPNRDAQSSGVTKSGSVADSASTVQSKIPKNALTKEELSEFTELFNTAEYNSFLVTGFNSPKDIEWNDCNYCTCISGEKEGNVYTVRFKMDTDIHYGIYADRVLKFTKENDELLMISNEIQWNDFCEKDKTFDANLTQFDSPLRFYTYNVNPEKTEIDIVKDGKHLTTLYYYYAPTPEAHYPISIDDIDFFDFNADGFQDIVVLGHSSYCGKKIFLHEYDDLSNDFNDIAELDEKHTLELKDNFTIAGVKKYLLGDNENAVYNNYKEAYAQIAKSYHLDYRYNYKFDLVYIDDDDIPELAVDPGACVSLFAYEDGYIHRLMDGWSYGAGGNCGYSYVERKNIILNYVSYSGEGTSYTTFMSKRDKGEIAEDYCIEQFDYDGNSSIKYHNYTDKKMSEKEIKEITTKYSNYEYKELSASMDYETLLAELNK